MRGWRGQASVPIRPTPDALPGLTTITGSVGSIDPVARTVTLARSSPCCVDEWVLTCGFGLFTDYM
ncbi:hypothetical protein LAUMK142_00797 [Mycobacterium pseudokansasii]|uniref:Uncharacterized protein n=1 Tax=Mycobacterium pseudokansasii TaxID=2341080 RepID=A0A498QMV6_9MYCO|nr:hypothetical protein LAUMK142_00797 [Mycobacterium pseudokansasii]